MLSQEVTGNESFLYISDLLQSLGIQNNKFMLKTLDKELTNVNPFDENISDDLKKRIIKESRNNIMYFIRELVRVPQCDGKVTEYKLNLSNASSIYLTDLDISHYVVSPRGKGDTTTALVDILWTHIINNSDSSVSLGSDRVELKNIMYRRLEGLWDLLPQYIKEACPFDSPHVNITKETNVEDSSFSENQSLCYDGSKPEPLLESILSGETTNISTHIFTGIQPKEDISKYLVDWETSYFDKDILDLLDIVGNKFFHVKYSYKELGESDDWFNTMSSMFMGHKETIDRELLLIRN